MYISAQLCPALCDPMDCSLPTVPLSMEFLRQENWSGLPFPTPEDLPNPAIKPMSLGLLHWQAGFLITVPFGKPQIENKRPHISHSQSQETSPTTHTQKGSLEVKRERVSPHSK